MYISELIDKLQLIENEIGDVEVYVGENFDGSLDTVSELTISNGNDFIEIDDDDDGGYDVDFIAIHKKIT